VFEMFAGGHAGQACQRLLGRTGGLGVIDDQELSFGGGDRQRLGQQLDTTDEWMVDDVRREGHDVDVVTRP
jgi:hypothetical protein